MYVAGLELPGELIDAHRDGRLVLFVGAGASRPDPSCLPDFVGLVKTIAERTGQECPPYVDDAPDRALGVLDAEEGVDVHSLVQERILESGEPSEIHRQLSGLALSTPQPRIVTTNYDLHLSTCLRHQWQGEGEFKEYAAPALPQGDDFEGLVYLHGSVGGPAAHLVATDADFANAYIRRRWASDFLLRMFEAYAVLFVGYSMDDILMRYLSLGPLAGSSRFALVSSKKPELTERFAIGQVVYDDHERLPGLLTDWNNEIRLSLHDHRTRVQSILRGTPPLHAASEAYLRESLALPERRKFFLEFARGREWLTWAAKQPNFFTHCEAAEDVDHGDAWDLSWWFAHTYAVDCGRSSGEEQNQLSPSELALQIVLGLETAIGPTLRRALIFAIRGADDDSRSELLRRWLPVLLEGVMPYEAGHLGMLLDKCSLPKDRRAAVQLIEHLTTPRLAPQPHASAFSPALLDLKLDGGLREAHWATAVRPRLPEFAADLAPVFDHQLRVASRLASLDPTIQDDLDWFSATRICVRRTEFDHVVTEDASGLVDMVREVLEALLVADPSKATLTLLSIWEQADEAILRRLAVHGWTQRIDIDSDQKLEWLIASGLMDDDALRAETQHLISSATSTASNEAIAELVGYIRESGGL